METPNYYRARIDLINQLITNTTNDGSVNNYYVLLRNGVIHPQLSPNQTEQQLIQQTLKTGNYSNQPLSFEELTTYNTWFAMHPEKVAGIEKVTTSFQFPITIKGSKQLILDTIQKGLKLTDVKQAWEMTQVAFNQDTRNIKIDGKVNIVDGKPIYTYSTKIKFGNNNKIFTIEAKNPLNGATAAERLHKKIIKQAIADNKPVPTKVLNEYPDLTKNVNSEKQKQRAIRLAEAEAEAILILLELEN